MEDIVKIIEEQYIISIYTSEVNEQIRQIIEYLQPERTDMIKMYLYTFGYINGKRDERKRRNKKVS